MRGQASPSSCGPTSFDGETHQSTPAEAVQELSTLQVLGSELSTRSPSSPSTSPTRTPHGAADSGSSTPGSARWDAPQPCVTKSRSEPVDSCTAASVPWDAQPCVRKSRSEPEPAVPAQPGVTQVDGHSALGRWRRFCEGLGVAPGQPLEITQERTQDPHAIAAGTNLDTTLLLPPSQLSETVLRHTPDEDMWDEIAARLRTPSPPGSGPPDLSEPMSPDLWLQLTLTPSPKNLQRHPLSAADEDADRLAAADPGGDRAAGDLQNETSQVTEDVAQADPFFLTPTLEYSLTGPIS